jgi:hypothetical protein
VHVDPPKTLSVETLRVDEANHLSMIGHSKLRQSIKQRENLGSPRQEPASQFAHHKRVRQDFAIE